MTKVIEKMAVPTLAPADTFAEAMKQQWGYFLVYEDGRTEFKVDDVSDKEKRHALKKEFNIEENA